MFLLQLLTVWGIVAAITLAQLTDDCPTDPPPPSPPPPPPSPPPPRSWGRRLGESGTIANNDNWMLEIGFLLSVLASILISLETLINSKMRWRQLRSGAGSLEALIWCFRTRVGAFELRPSDPDAKRPETSLAEALIAWRQDLVAGGDLHINGLGKEYHAKVYTHHQDAPASGAELVLEDDFHSPMQPQRYIDTRILPSIDFYRKRIPLYARRRYALRLVLLSCAIAATLLSRYGLELSVVLVSSGAAAVTSWSEFSDTARKTERCAALSLRHRTPRCLRSPCSPPPSPPPHRYTRAVFALTNLLSWWSSLSDVEKASTSMISHLIQTAEGIISDGRLGWLSTASSKAPQVAQGDGQDDEKKVVAKREGVESGGDDELYGA